MLMQTVSVRSPATLEGSYAPEFVLPDQNEEWVHLKDLTIMGSTMVVFYPGDFTMICTKQLCSYQDTLSEFKKFNIQLVGISPNHPEEHRKFIEKYKFEFPLLSDTGKLVTRAYGVTSLFSLGGTSRAVFIISREGKIIYRYVESTRLTFRRPEELLIKLEELRKAGEI